MKPNFALNLTDAAIGLLHRTSRGWLEIGATPLDAPDLAEALGYLRSSALGLSPQGMTTKVVIPNSQILYTEVDAPGPDAASRKAQIRAALEGRTPYAVDDLVFDWWGKGPRVQVAVIARETLQEAEDFATAHRFNPVSFVAIPEPGRFTGEPWFGQTSAASKLLAAGETVTRDQDPIQIVAREVPRDEAPAQTAAPVAPPKPAPAAEAAAAKAPEAAPPKAVEAAPPKAADPAPPKVTEAAPPKAPEVTPPKTAEADPAKAAPPVAAAEVPKPAAPSPAAPAVETAAKAPPAPEPAPAAAPVAEAPAPAAAAAPVVAPPKAAPVVTAEGLREPAPAAPSFSSRRRDDAAILPTLGPAQGRTVAAPPAPTPSAPAAPPASGTPAARPVDKSAPPPVTAAAAAPPAPKAAPPKPAAPPPAPATPKVDLKPLAKTLTAPKPAAGGIERPSPKAQNLAAVATTRRPGDKPAGQPARATADPLAAGRGARPRGKPRYLGLVLTGVLLLFLALVAAWSSIYLSDNDTGAEAPTGVAALPEAQPDGSITAPDAIALAPEAMDPEMAADLAAAAEEPAPEGQTPLDALPPAAVAEAPVEALPAPDDSATADAPVAPAPPASDATELPAPPVDVAEPAAAPVAQPPAAEPAPAAPAQLEARRLVVPGPEGQDEIFLAATDSPPPAFDAVALPVPVASADAAPDAPMPPPPPGEIYQFDADGRIVPTERGVVTPGGFWLIAARPDPLPPPRPAGLTPPAPAPEQAATDAAVDAALQEATAPATADPVAADSAFQPDPAFVATRPRARPAGLVPPAPATEPPQQAEDDASAAPLVDPRFAAVRPRERPLTVIARAEEARRATESASLAVAAATATAPQGWDPNASPLAVPMSRRPAPRPADMTRVVAAAAAAAVRPADPPAALDPEEEDEPEVASAAPRIPTRASVAKQATFVNAINLSRLNLIGIYGTPSNRSALVRSSSGRYSKVEVGDRLDGGTVAAITATELRYQKGGRMLVLEMPRG